FALCVTLVCSLVVGLIPALDALRASEPSLYSIRCRKISAARYLSRYVALLETANRIHSDSKTAAAR
ncbi:MAG: hypothetical protein ABJA67_02465, partial [Chthonomonadales bacterium]